MMFYLRQKIDFFSLETMLEKFYTVSILKARDSTFWNFKNEVFCFKWYIFTIHSIQRKF